MTAAVHSSWLLCLWKYGVRRRGTYCIMVVVEEFLFSEVEHKIELFPFRVHWTLLSCEHTHTHRERNQLQSSGWLFSTFTHDQWLLPIQNKRVGIDVVVTQSEASFLPLYIPVIPINLSLSLTHTHTFLQHEFPTLVPWADLRYIDVFLGYGRGTGHSHHLSCNC